MFKNMFQINVKTVCDVEIDTTEHLITKCERWKNKRDQILGYNNSIRVLHDKPKQTLEYLRSIGRL